MPAVLDKCSICRYWTTYNGVIGDCEHPQIRLNVICIADPCYRLPEQTAGVGYRTNRDFGCNLFKILTAEQQKDPTQRLASKI